MSFIVTKDKNVFKMTRCWFVVHRELLQFAISSKQPQTDRHTPHTHREKKSSFMHIHIQCDRTFVLQCLTVFLQTKGVQNCIWIPFLKIKGFLSIIRKHSQPNSVFLKSLFCTSSHYAYFKNQEVLSESYNRNENNTDPADFWSSKELFLFFFFQCP